MYVIEKKDFVEIPSKVEVLSLTPMVTYREPDEDRQKLWDDACSEAIDDTGVLSDAGWAVECDLGTKTKNKITIRSQMTGELLESFTLMELVPVKD